MSLIKCKECGEEISSKADKCPKCGNPIKKKSNSGCLFLFIVIAAILFWGLLLSDSSGYSGKPNSTSKAPASPPTTAEIRKTITTLYITNTNDFAWVNPKIYVNGIVGGYRYTWQGTVQSMEQLEIGLLNFTKRNGARLQPLQTDVKEIMVAVDGHDSSIYNF
jgi:hypothetical protein